MSAIKWHSKAAKHPVLAHALKLVFVITLTLGVAHECRIAGEVLIVLVRHVKYELTALADVAERLERELTMWKSDP